MACWKMVGFEVTPSTPSSIIRCRFPFWMSSRESESTQTLCPISCSFFSRSFTATTSSFVLRLAEQFLCLSCHGLVGKAKLFLQVLQRRGRPEDSHADGPPAQSDILPPTKGGSLLYQDALGEVEGGPHACVLCLAGSGNIESRAVVHAGAEERQADRHVDARVETHQLHGYVPLVVVLHHHYVEIPSSCPHEHRVRRPGTRCVYTLLHGGRDGGRYLICVLGTEEAALAGVGVQTGDGHFRFFDAELAQSVVGKMDHGELPLGPHPLYGLS